MSPIINPIWFYLIGISENLADTLWISGILLTIAGIFATMVVVTATERERNASNFPLIKKWRKAAIFGILLITLGNLVPNEKTCYQMMAASMITPNNLEIVGNSAKDVVDYIVESVDELLENKK